MTRNEDIDDADLKLGEAIKALEEVRDMFKNYSILDFEICRVYDSVHNMSQALTYTRSRLNGERDVSSA